VVKGGKGKDTSCFEKKNMLQNNLPNPDNSQVEEIFWQVHEIKELNEEKS